MEGFKDMIDQRTVDIIHPDMETSGGLMETKMIAEAAFKNDMGVMFHHADHLLALWQVYIAPAHFQTSPPWKIMQSISPGRMTW